MLVVLITMITVWFPGSRAGAERSVNPNKLVTLLGTLGVSGLVCAWSWDEGVCEERQTPTPTKLQ